MKTAYETGHAGEPLSDGEICRSLDIEDRRLQDTKWSVPEDTPLITGKPPQKTGMNAFIISWQQAKGK